MGGPNNFAQEVRDLIRTTFHARNPTLDTILKDRTNEVIPFVEQMPPAFIKLDSLINNSTEEMFNINIQQNSETLGTFSQKVLRNANSALC